jgi:hypothetical protein
MVVEAGVQEYSATIDRRRLMADKRQGQDSQVLSLPRIVV